MEVESLLVPLKLILNKLILKEVLATRPSLGSNRVPHIFCHQKNGLSQIPEPQEEPVDVVTSCCRAICQWATNTASIISALLLGGEN